MSQFTGKKELDACGTLCGWTPADQALLWLCLSENLYLKGLPGKSQKVETENMGFTFSSQINLLADMSRMLLTF